MKVKSRKQKEKLENRIDTKKAKQKHPSPHTTRVIEGTFSRFSIVHTLSGISHPYHLFLLFSIQFRKTGYYG